MPDKEVPALPEKWEIRPLRDLFTRLTERNTIGCGNVLTVSAEHGLVSQTNYFKRIVASSNLGNYYLLNKGDFAYNKSHSVGQPFGVIRQLRDYDQGVLSPLYICFRAANSVLDADYARVFFQANMLNGQLARVADQGARDHGLLNVRPEDFMSMAMWYPPLSEQRRIAEILDTLDETIRKTERLIAKLQQAKQGLLHDLLTRGIDDKGELRDPERHPEQFKDSVLGRIPKDWEEIALSKLCKRITYGFTNPMPTVSEGPWMLTAADIDYDAINYASARKTNQTAFSRLTSKSRPEIGDLLITKDGTLGRVAILDRDGVCVNQSVAVIALKEQSRARFLTDYLLSPTAQERILADAGGSAIKHIYITKLAEMIVPAPPTDEALEISLRIRSVNEWLASEQAGLFKLRTLKSGLMDDLLTGRVRVPM